MVDILTVLILIVDFGFSIWNAYASGLNVEMLRREGGGSSWLRMVAYSGLGLAYSGASYVMLIVIGYVAYALGYISSDVIGGILGLDFLLFGLLIIGFGLMVTVQSIIMAVRRSIGSIAIAIWNTFVEIWDIASYAEGFGEAVSLVKGAGGDERDETSLIIVVIVALSIAYFIVHAAYIQGKAKAQGIGSGNRTYF